MLTFTIINIVILYFLFNEKKKKEDFWGKLNHTYTHTHIHTDDFQIYKKTFTKKSF